MHIRRATIADLPKAAELFDAYRQFYDQPPDYELAENFIRERLTNNDSTIFLALDPQTNAGVGFAQLYPSFSSISARPIWILNDLFVVSSARRRGIGRKFLYTVREYAISTGAKRLVLSTARTNHRARKIYEEYGYKQDETYLVYELKIE